MAQQSPSYSILFYEYVPDMMEKRTPHREEHLKLIRSYRDKGHIFMAGALANPLGKSLE